MSSDLSTLVSYGFIKPLTSHSDFRQWLLAAIDIFSVKHWFSLIEGQELRPTSSNEDYQPTPDPSNSSDFASSSNPLSTRASSSSSESTVDPKVLESQQAWNTKAIKVRDFLGRMLDANHREVYTNERNAAIVCSMLNEYYHGKDKQRIRHLRSELSKVHCQGDEMSEFIFKLQKLLNQLLSAGCTAYDYEDKVFLLLNNLPLEYHPIVDGS